MTGSRVAKRYARALFETALGKKLLEAVEADLAALSKSYRESSEFRELIDSPVISSQAKQKVFTALFKNRLQELTLRFVILLIAKNREVVLMQIIADFGELLDQHRGILRGSVSSVVPLSAEQLKSLGSRLDKMTGKKVMVQQHLDETLLGGFVVKLQDRVWDASLRNRLEKLRQSLIES